MLKSKIVGKTVGIIILSRGGIMAIKEVVEDNGIIHREWKIVKDNGLDSMRSRPLPLIMEHLPRDFSSHNLNLHIAVLPLSLVRIMPPMCRWDRYIIHSNSDPNHITHNNNIWIILCPP